MCGIYHGMIMTIQDCEKQIYNTPYLRNVIIMHTSLESASSSIEIDVGLPRFSYYSVFISLLKKSKIN